ncbi:FAD-dependent monooxygenase [Agromyces arachidis]|uniref:FAD-dependent monooxygenase n=1 Tax=Agromyces arachidis TaxID=766966 RepID=UPI004056784D
MRATVVGAGMAGLVVARQLALAGWQVDVLEQAPGPREDGYMMDFFGHGFDAAERIGVLPRLREAAYRIGEVEYVDDRGRRRASLDYDRFASALGGRLISLMRPDLERVLLESLDVAPSGSVRVHYDRRAGMGVGDAEARRIIDAADLVVGADGIHSSVRRGLFGDETAFLRPMGLRAAAFTVDDPELHARFAGRFVLTDTIDRQAGVYSLRDGRVAAFLAYREGAFGPAIAPPGSEAVIGRSDARERLRHVFAGMWPPIDRLLEGCPPAPYDDVVAQVDLPQWSDRRRTVLVGDACQAVSLLAGQGASLAVAGAALLAELVGPNRDAAGIGSALAEYERRWRPVVEETQLAGRRAANSFLPSSRWQRFVRRIVLRATRLPGVDRLVMRSLAGSSGVP